MRQALWIFVMAGLGCSTSASSVSGIDGAPPHEHDAVVEDSVDAAVIDCGENPTEIASFDTVLQDLPASWGPPNQTRSQRFASGYYVATTYIELYTDEVPLSYAPVECQFCSELIITTDYRVPGLLVQWDAAAQKTVLRIEAGSVFRARAIYHVGGVSGGEYPTIHLEAGCSQDCAFNEMRCDIDQGCYGEDIGHCTSCLGRPNLNCQCIDKDLEPKDNGSPCLYIVTDIAHEGHCQDSWCVCNASDCQ